MLMTARVTKDRGSRKGMRRRARAPLADAADPAQIGNTASPARPNGSLPSIRLTITPHTS